jgi:tRNA uridine 5-carboxymethylaminomethyl modification enzyme
MDRVLYKKTSVEAIKKVLDTTPIDVSEINPYFEQINSSPLLERQKASKIILRPNVTLNAMMQHSQALQQQLQHLDAEVLEQAEIQVKYERYIEKENELVQRMAEMEDLIIPDSFDYEKVSAISAEALQKFKKIKPRTLGQAGRISGVNPSDIQILMVFMGR